MTTTISTQTKVERHFTHARKCKHLLDECKVCKLGMQDFAELPPLTLSAVLEDKRTSPLKTSFAAVAVENLISRTADKSRRAKRDSDASMFYLKGYSGRGGGL